MFLALRCRIQKYARNVAKRNMNVEVNTSTYWVFSIVETSEPFIFNLEHLFMMHQKLVYFTWKKRTITNWFINIKKPVVLENKYQKIPFCFSVLVVGCQRTNYFGDCF